MALLSQIFAISVSVQLYTCTCLLYFLWCIHLKCERQIYLKFVGLFVAKLFWIPIYNNIHVIHVNIVIGLLWTPSALKNIKICLEKDFTFSPTENYPFLSEFEVLPLLTSQTVFHPIFTWRRPWKKWEPGPIAYSATWKTTITKTKYCRTLEKG